MHTIEFIKIFKKQIAKNEKRDNVSDYLVAKRLGITGSAVSKWQHGVNSLDEIRAIYVADYCGLNRGYVLAMTHADRAQSEVARRELEKLGRLARRSKPKRRPARS